jgi:hypothetical protein
VQTLCPNGRPGRGGKGSLTDFCPSFDLDTRYRACLAAARSVADDRHARSHDGTDSPHLLVALLASRICYSGPKTCFSIPSERRSVPKDDSGRGRIIFTVTHEGQLVGWTGARPGTASTQRYRALTHNPVEARYPVARREIAAPAPAPIPGDWWCRAQSSTRSAAPRY